MRKYQWIIILISIFVIVGMYQSVTDLWSRKGIVSERKKKLEAIRGEYDRLVKKYEEVQTPEFVEKEARDKLGLAKEGETVVIVDTSKIDSLLKVGTDVGSSVLPNWKRWWQLFF